MEQKIIGISPGTRHVGMATLSNGKLLDWRVHTYQGPWSNTKLKLILKSIMRWVKKSHSRIIAVKIPDELPTSKNYIQLIGTMNRMFDQKGYTVFYYSLSDLKTHWCPHRELSKITLTECVIDKYQELLPEYHTGLNCKTDYYHKIFEAVAAANLAHYENTR